MQIQNCVNEDVDAILKLYEAARLLQTSKKMVVWPFFESKFLEKEISNKEQWKLIMDGKIACNWATTFTDKEIWEEKEKGDAVYIHRIATNPLYKGNNFVVKIVEWAKNYAL